MKQWLRSIARAFHAPEESPLKAPLQQNLAAVETERLRQNEARDRELTIRHLSDALLDSRVIEQQHRREYVERSMELIEARQMAGAGPWLAHEQRASVSSGGATLRESNPILSQGAYGDIELALQNVEWRREVNLSWLEFSRWGIQQIILVSRLYYIKNPIIRRLIDVCAAYVFARGVDISSTDDAANEVLTEFINRNKKVLGQIALVDLERRKDYDGNLFFAFFADTKDKGLVSIRTIDATEMMDIICDPNDTDTPWYYRRSWTERTFSEANGTVTTTTKEAWYPDIAYDPANKPKSIAGLTVEWKSPVYHRKCGGVAKWHFGCPRIYPAIDWAQASKRFLEACATVKQSLAQIAMTLTTKGGQQALEGAKQQLQTTVGPSSALWDTNPTAVNASIFASGPGTTLAAFNTTGAGGDPEEVRQYKLMCCMVKGVPETFLADVSTGNLATATSLDRPTETAILELQEAWIEDLNVIGTYVLRVSAGAPSGLLRESVSRQPIPVVIREGRRVRLKDGRMGYEAKTLTPGTIEVRTNFPAIREGDVPALVAATVAAITLGASDGQAHGCDLRAGVGQLYDLLPGIEDGDELLDKQFPNYDPARDLKAEAEARKPQPPANSVKPTEALTRRLAGKLLEAMEAERNGNSQHTHGG